jgi:hypothetical protein
MLYQRLLQHHLKMKWLQLHRHLHHQLQILRLTIQQMGLQRQSLKELHHLLLQQRLLVKR